MKGFARCLVDNRAPEKIRHTLEGVIGQRVFGTACGHPDGNDADQLAEDPSCTRVMPDFATSWLYWIVTVVMIVFGASSTGVRECRRRATQRSSGARHRCIGGAWGGGAEDARRRDCDSGDSAVGKGWEAMAMSKQTRRNIGAIVVDAMYSFSGFAY